MQQSAGFIRVKLPDGTYRADRIEVWVDIDEETGDLLHVYVVAGRRQLTDFPFGHPNECDHGLGFVAMRLINDDLEEVDYVWPEDQQIIDLDEVRALRRQS